VIAKSDLVILLVSASALSMGIVRWQMNIAVEPTPGVAAPAVSTVSAERAEPTRVETVPAAPVQARTAPQPSVTDEPRSAETLPPTASPRAGPGDAAPAANPTTDSTTAASESLFGVYEVVSGDSLGGIAQRLGTSVAQLRQINELESTRILIGQRLRYPQAAN